MSKIIIFCWVFISLLFFGVYAFNNEQYEDQYRHCLFGVPELTPKCIAERLETNADFRAATSIKRNVPYVYAAFSLMTILMLARLSYSSESSFRS